MSHFLRVICYLQNITGLFPINYGIFSSTKNGLVYDPKSLGYDPCGFYKVKKMHYSFD